MKYTLLILTFLVSLLIPEVALGSTYYSKATATASGAGKVYVSATQTDNPVYNTESSATQSISNEKSHTYYFYAKADEGMCFSAWSDGKTDNPYKYTVTATSTNESSPTTVTLSALFKSREELPPVQVSAQYGTVKTSGNNRIGGNVNICAQADWTIEGQVNPSYVFDGWYDENGELFSDKADDTFKVDRVIDLEARWTLLDGQIDGPGYYRIANMFHDYVKLVDDKTISFSTNTTSFAPDLVWYQTPTHYYYNYSNTAGPFNNMYAEPGIIFYVDGTLTGDNYKTYTSGKAEIMSGVTLSAQGVTANDHFKYNNSTPPLRITWSGANKNQYHLLSTINNFTGAFKFVFDPADVPVMMKNNSDTFDDMHFEAVDLEHVDSNWFGVFPDEDMEDGDGFYWASLYTAFPYQCYEPDGVEAYYAKTIGEQDGQMVVSLKQFEDNIVPPHTPALLKCPKVIDTTDYLAASKSTYRQWHATPEPANRLVPLMPSAELETKAAEVAAENLLGGSYQLLSHTKVTANSSIRVLNSVNGTVGFYKMTDGTELTANRAYLQLPADVAAKASALRFVFDGEYNGIEDVVADTDSHSDDVYDLYGRKVKEMIPGHFYVVKGKKIIAK